MEARIVWREESPGEGWTPGVGCYTWVGGQERTHRYSWDYSFNLLSILSILGLGGVKNRFDREREDRSMEVVWVGERRQRELRLSLTQDRGETQTEYCQTLHDDCLGVCLELRRQHTRQTFYMDLSLRDPDHRHRYQDYPSSSD